MTEVASQTTVNGWIRLESAAQVCRTYESVRCPECGRTHFSSSPVAGTFIRLKSAA
jgi:hypothetical protein